MIKSVLVLTLSLAQAVAASDGFYSDLDLKELANKVRTHPTPTYDGAPATVGVESVYRLGEGDNPKAGLVPYRAAVGDLTVGGETATTVTQWTMDTNGVWHAQLAMRPDAKDATDDTFKSENGLPLCGFRGSLRYKALLEELDKRLKEKGKLIKLDGGKPLCWYKGDIHVGYPEISGESPWKDKKP